MATINVANIKPARVKMGYSQDEVARRIGVSRPSYIKIEEGDKELTLSQASDLAKVLELDYEQAYFASKETLNKYQDMIYESIRHGGSTKDNLITKTKLAKLLYLIDAEWFIKKGKTMSGMTYRRLPQGPVPFEFFQVIDELNSNGLISIKLSGLAHMIGATEAYDFEENSLRKDEKNLIKEICSAWRDKRTDAIVNHTHAHPTWLQASEYSPINMNLLKDLNERVY